MPCRRRAGPRSHRPTPCRRAPVKVLAELGGFFGEEAVHLLDLQEQRRQQEPFELRSAPTEASAGRSPSRAYSEGTQRRRTRALAPVRSLRSAHRCRPGSADSESASTPSSPHRNYPTPSAPRWRPASAKAAIRPLVPSGALHPWEGTRAAGAVRREGRRTERGMAWVPPCQTSYRRNSRSRENRCCAAATRRPRSGPGEARETMGWEVEVHRVYKTVSIASTEALRTSAVFPPGRRRFLVEVPDNSPTE